MFMSKADLDLNETSVGELYGVTNEVKEYLLVSLLIVEYHERHILINMCFNLEALLQNLELHDLRQFLHGLPDIKESQIDLKFVVFKTTHV